MELVPMAEFTIVTRNSSKAWIPELIAAAGPDVTETYIDFFTSTIRNRNTRAAYARACWQFFGWCGKSHHRIHRIPFAVQSTRSTLTYVTGELIEIGLINYGGWTVFFSFTDNRPTWYWIELESGRGFLCDPKNLKPLSRSSQSGSGSMVQSA